MTNHILALDPSMGGFGWAVLDPEHNILAKGCIKTSPSPKKLKMRKGDDRARRIQEINTKLIKIIKHYNIKLIVSEQPHGSQSAIAALMIGIVLGIVQTLADSFNIAIEYYFEGDCKNHLLGKRGAEKKETINAIAKEYLVDWTGIKYKDEAVADALAVYHVARSQSSIMRIL